MLEVVGCSRNYGCQVVGRIDLPATPPRALTGSLHDRPSRPHHHEILLINGLIHVVIVTYLLMLLPPAVDSVYIQNVERQSE